MNPYIPKMMRRPIEREIPLEYEADEHPSTKKNKEAAKAHEEYLRKIEACCQHLRESNPGAWDELQKVLIGMYGHLYGRNSASPYHYMAKGFDSGYWPICEAFNRGQLIILEKFIVTLGMQNSKFTTVSEVRISGLKTFFIIVFDKLKKLCKVLR